MQKPARKHHYLPVFYTKQWAGADGQVERFTKHGKVVDRRVHPSRVGWELDLYRIPLTDDHQAQMLEERFFRQLDDIAAVALRKMNSDDNISLTARETTAWSLFMMSLLHRSPEYLRATKDASRRIWTETLPDLRDRYPQLRSAADPLTFDEYVDQRDPLETERSLLQTLPQLIANPRIGQFLNNMYWIKFDVPAGERELLLSDNPLARTNGIKVPGGHLAMPLSPRRLLVAMWERSMIDKFDEMPLRELTRNMNRWTVQSARHFVVASDLSQQAFIRKHFGADPKPALNTTVGQ
jgi:hypothetical protein